MLLAIAQSFINTVKPRTRAEDRAEFLRKRRQEGAAESAAWEASDVHSMMPTLVNGNALDS